MRIWLLATAAAMLAGCATTPQPVPEAVKPPASKAGGYYQDDGPDDNPPANLQATPDASPRAEPPHRFANRPYTVLGSPYVPRVSDQPYKERGTASWYGRKFHGKKTASGEVYDMYAMTAAHRTLPIPSYVRVTNVANRRSVLLRVNDRGPFHANRVIDLSYTAALKLGLLAGGSGMVEVERVFDGDATVVAGGSTAMIAAPGASVTSSPAALYLQLGAFASMRGAQTFREQVRRDLTWLAEAVDILVRDGLYRVRLGPYATQTEAAAIAEKVRQSLDVVPQIAGQ